MRAMMNAEAVEVAPDVPELPDDLENDADYVMDTWLAHRLHGVYPAAGGYDDQDASLMHDWRRMTLHYLRAKQGHFSGIPEVAAVGEWQGIMKD